MQSRASNRVVPRGFPSLRVTFCPLNRGMLALGSSMLSPFQPKRCHKCYRVRVVANLLNGGAGFLYDFLVSLLAVGWLGGTHLQPSPSLFCQKAVLMGLPVLGATGFKLTNTSRHRQDGSVSPRHACKHVFEKVSVLDCHDDHIIPAGLECSHGVINGDTMFKFSFQFI